MPEMRLVLLGDPVAHSRSPAIHRAALAASGIDGDYTARRSGPEGVAAACAEIRRGDLDGVNVTMPLKTVALAEAEVVSDVAARAGAVNTLSQADGKVRGDNTDVWGVRRAWTERGLPDGVPVLVLGGGGAAAAAMVALEEARLLVATRHPGKGAALAARIGVSAAETPWGEPAADAVIVNATPLGMKGEELPAALLDNAAGLLDMAYGRDPTPAVLAMADRPVADGLDVLVYQAAAAFEIWTKKAAPIGVMDEAARRRGTP